MLNDANAAALAPFEVSLTAFGKQLEASMTSYPDMVHGDAVIVVLSSASLARRGMFLPALNGACI